MSHLVQQTSLDAFESIQPHVGKLDDRIFDYVLASGISGMTSHEIVASSQKGIQSISGALRRLTLADRIEDSGRRRLTPSNRSAIAWVKKGLKEKVS